MPLAPQLLELPLILGSFAMSAAMMGLSGADIHQWGNIRGAMEATPLADFVTLEDNGWLRIQLVILIVGAVTFLVSLISIGLCARQFGKRRGEYTGKGTSAWILVGLLFLLLSGAVAGSAGAVTAWAVTRSPEYAPGPAFSEPFDLTQQLFLREIMQDLIFGVPGSLNTLNGIGASGIDSSYLGEWNVATLDEANDLISRYLDQATRWRAVVIVTWFTLGPVFLTMVVHFALPFVWKWLGLIRTESPKARKKYQYENV